jgi:hypothetical protein
LTGGDFISVELRRRITSAKRTTATDLNTNYRRTLGDNSNDLLARQPCQLQSPGELNALCFVAHRQRPSLAAAKDDGGRADRDGQCCLRN